MKMHSDKRELDKIYKRRDRYEIPDWQREEVWDPPRKQLLIDSILRGWRLPKFYFVLTSANPQTYEVVDGQQRLSTIFEFLSDELELSEKTAKEFGGKTYKSLPMDVSDQIDDFEIDFDEIQDATDNDLMDFFQRLQSGLQLNSSEKLNSIPSKLKTFCKKQSKHKFFTKHVAFNDKRYAHFDVMAKVATLEAEGVEAALRYADVKDVFESQATFSEQSQVAKRILSALDYLAYATPEKTKTFRNRSITQSFITLTLVQHLYFLFWEGPGSKLAVKPPSFMDINALRTELEHDTDHGKAKDVVKKKLKHGHIFQKYAGSTSPSVASPARFPLAQLRLLNAVKADLQGLLSQYV